MKKSIKRITSLLLISMLVLGSVMTGQVSAAEENHKPETEQVETVKQRETEQKVEKKENEQEEKTTQEQSVSKTRPEIIINYCVLDKADISGNMVQNIVVGIDTDHRIDDANILMKNMNTGDELTIKASNSVGGAVLFATPKANQLVAGVYSVKSIEYKIGDYQYKEELEKIGIIASFGVNTVAEKKPDAYIIQESEDKDTGNITPDIMNIEKQTKGDLRIKANYASNGKTTVVLDAGHGGHDTGAICVHGEDTYYEKDVVLKIALYCKNILEKSGKYNVYLTRSSDEYLELEERVNIARDKGASLLVSFHLNSIDGAPQSRAQGVEVYVPNANYNEKCHTVSQATGERIVNQLVALGLRKRGEGVKVRNGDKTYPDGSTADYLAINRIGKLNGIPSVLIEHCFIDSTTDLGYFNSDARIKELAEADAKGIIGSFQDITNYESIFNASYYANKYPDLRKAFGYDYMALLSHFIDYGMKEGRQGCELFNVYSYMRQYKDLRRAFGTNLPSYYWHFCNYGYSEGRSGTGCSVMTNYETTYNGFNYSAVYNYNDYKEYNPDLYRLFGEDDLAMLSHFVNYGVYEGRRASKNFDVRSYRRQYPDLRRAFGDTLYLYTLHYAQYGKREGRAGTGCNELRGATTVLNGVDYSAVYNYNEYSKYGDLKRAFGEDDIAMLSHFVSFGMNEGRKGNTDFDARSYRLQYGDLRRAFGNDLKSYYMHYIQYGKREGRAGTGCTELRGALTVFNGVDYSDVYDYREYSKYGDLKRAFGEDDVAMLNHFVSFGMSEGRQAKASFNMKVYMNKYGDLRAAYGSDYRLYYLHFIQYGKKEGRTAV
ncbi:MAG: N-acetylmuramoyl-L-alanine amidase [Lachnospiraceae bacterium]|nr:N-acetylmuramoyl-L-alanine amidase [Lachnospiraceae bacterium]